MMDRSKNASAQGSIRGRDEEGAGIVRRCKRRAKVSRHSQKLAFSVYVTLALCPPPFKIGRAHV